MILPMAFPYLTSIRTIIFLPLPAYYDKESESGTVVCCWELSFIERLKVLFKGEIWLSLMSFNKPLTPHRLTIDKWDILNKEYFEAKNKENEN
jgi:hypothetical protein